MEWALSPATGALLREYRTRTEGHVTMEVAIGVMQLQGQGVPGAAGTTSS